MDSDHFAARGGAPREEATLTRHLLDRMLAGDHDSERRLFEKYRPRLLRRVRADRSFRALSDRIEPDDVVQEVYWRFLSSGLFERFEDRGRGALEALLNSVLDRTLTDTARRLTALKRGGDGVSVPLDETERPLHVAQSPREPTPTSNARESELVELCRRTLSAREWKVWYRAELSGWSGAETARFLGETPEAIRGVLHRARKKLIAALGGDAYAND